MESTALLHLRQQQQQQQVRQRRVEDACARYNDSWNWQDAGKSFVVSHKLRVIFCMVGKSACTNWIRVLLQLTDDPAAQALAVTDRASVHAMVGMYLQWTSIQNASRLSRPLFNDYYKFLFVREPLERLVSAYRDKMSRAQWYIPLRQNIVKLFRRHASQKYGLHIHRCFTGDR